MIDHPQESASGGFTVRRRLHATAARVHTAFVEPSKLEQWFVVPGYRTPADRMRVTAEPGGRAEAVMVSDADTGDNAVELSYEFLSWPAPSDEAASRRGVEAMLDLIEAGIDRGSI